MKAGHVVAMALGAGLIGGLLAGVLQGPVASQATPHPLSTGGPPGVDAVEARLEDIRDAIRALADEIRNASRAVGPPGSPRLDGRPRQAEIPQPPPAPDPASAAPALKAPANLERLGAVDAWSTDPELRRQFLFLAEAQVLHWFGTPDRISTNESGAVEFWQYYLDQEGQRRKTIVLRQGRLIDVR